MRRQSVEVGSRPRGVQWILVPRQEESDHNLVAVLLGIERVLNRFADQGIDSAVNLFTLFFARKELSLEGVSLDELLRQLLECPNRSGHDSLPRSVLNETREAA